MKILVADDEPTSRLIVQLALRSLGHECHTVADGAKAWDAFRWGRPDVVIDLSTAARTTKRLIRIMFLELNEGPARDLTCGGWKSLCQKHRLSCQADQSSSWTASAEVASGSCAAFTRPRPRSRCVTSRSR